jgi:hypothetical protein
MSEGLGQKYGAPRRRAQEQLRTSVTRDEHSAGKVDELLAQLDFFCKEAERREEDQAAKDNNPESSAENSGNVPPEELLDEGRQNMKEASDHWNLLLKVRSALQQRADFLKVIDTPLSYPDLPWASVDRFLKTKKGEESTVAAATAAVANMGIAEDDEKSVEVDPAAVHFHTGGLTSLEQLFEQVESACRKETRELYESEGKLDALGPKGIPDSLQQWLDEVRYHFSVYACNRVDRNVCAAYFRRDAPAIGHH